jgi:hypothetical protein
MINAIIFIGRKMTPGRHYAARDFSVKSIRCALAPIFKGLSSSMAQVRFAFRNLSISRDFVKILTKSRRLAYRAHANPINREKGKPVGKRFGI